MQSRVQGATLISKLVRAGTAGPIPWRSLSNRPPRKGTKHSGDPLVKTQLSFLPGACSFAWLGVPCPLILSFSLANSLSTLSIRPSKVGFLSMHYTGEFRRGCSSRLRLCNSPPASFRYSSSAAGARCFCFCYSCCHLSLPLKAGAFIGPSLVNNASPRAQEPRPSIIHFALAR